MAVPPLCSQTPVWKRIFPKLFFVRQAGLEGYMLREAGESETNLMQERKKEP
jgi:hypothetical protein